MKVTYSSPLFISSTGNGIKKKIRGSILERTQSGFLFRKKDVTVKRLIISVGVINLFKFESTAEYIPSDASRALEVYNYNCEDGKELSEL